MSASWRRVMLGEIAAVTGGGTPARGDASNFGRDIPWVTPSDLPALGVPAWLGETEEGLSAKGLAASSASELPPGAVLFSSRASIGKIAVTNRRCCTNQGFVNFVPRPEVDPWFLAFSLAYHTPRIARLSGETTFKEVSRGKLKAYEIDVPDLEEQRRVIGAIRNAMGRVEEVLTLEREQRQFVEELPVAWLTESLDALRASEPSSTLMDLASSMASGPFGSQLLHSEFAEDGHLVIGIANVQEHRFNPVRKWLVNDAKLSELARFRVVAGDVLVTVMGTVGRCCVVPEGIGTAVTSKHVYRIRLPDSRLRPRYLSALINFDRRTRRTLIGTATGGVMPGLNGAKLKSLRIPVPSLRDQDNLVEGLDRVLALRDQWVNTDETDDGALHTAILRQAFSGGL